jgi:hypothetical protein
MCEFTLKFHCRIGNRTIVLNISDATTVNYNRKMIIQCVPDVGVPLVLEELIPDQLLDGDFARRQTLRLLCPIVQNFSGL